MGELYHGSSKKGIMRLEPHKSTHGNYVYATPYKELAIIFSGRCGDDCTYALYRNNENEPWQMVERIPEAFDTMFSNSSSIYTLDDTTFKDIHTGFAEVVSEVGVNTNSEEFLINVYDAIKKLANDGKIQLYIYPNKPKEIPQDSSDLIDKQIRQHQRNNSPITKQSFERIVLLHPYLIDKVNQKMMELDLNTEPYKKEDLISLFSKAVIRQAIKPDREQYLNSIVISISSIYPDLLPRLNKKLSFLSKTKEEKISYIIDELSSKFENIPIELVQQMKEKYFTDTRPFFQIGKEIIDYVNNRITLENQNVRTNDNDLPLKDNDSSVVSKDTMSDLFIKNSRYKRLLECFIELAETDIQKNAIEQIMKNGEYNGFKLNSMLSNEKYSEKAEIKRRIAFAEMILHDESLFFYLVNNGLNVFHGTKIDALQTILSKGLFSSSELSEKKIQLRTGEEQAMNKIFGGNIEKRNFISLTDDFDTSASYAGFPYEEQTEYVKRYYGKNLASDEGIPIIICFNGNDIGQRYSKSLITVKSTCNEIGINSSINPSAIKCIITSYDKMEYVKSIASKYGIDVLGYNHNDKFQKRLINKEGKFYSSNMEIDEQKFERIKEKLKKKENNKNSQNANNEEHLGEDLAIASNVKMEIAFNLIEQYNDGVLVTPITADNLVTKYNINEKVAEQLASEINTMIELYIQEKESYTPYVLDGFDEGAQEISHRHK